MDRVYLVVGSSGDYGDYHTWTVRAFASERAANEWRDRCVQHRRARPRPPRQPDSCRWRTVQELIRVQATPEWTAWIARQTEHDERLRAYWAEGPDPGCSDEAEYDVEEVLFGAESTALETAPARVRYRERRLDLTSDDEP